MLEFKSFSLPENDYSFTEKEWCDSLFKISDLRITEHCYTSLFAWSDVYNTTLCRYKNMLLVRSVDGETASYVFPAGEGDLKECIKLMMEDAAKIGKKFSLFTISPSKIPLIESLFPGEFEFAPARNSFDYIYDREQLATLSGKKFQPKRNLISRFKDHPVWSYETIEYQNRERCLSLLDECSAMNDIWCKNHDCIHNVSVRTEHCAVGKMIKYFIPLKLKGGLLRVDGNVVAFTIGERVNSDTFIVHVEKAFLEIKGAYQMINQAFILQEAMDCVYINREDDAGDEGLRKAKLSYNPIFMEEKYCAIKK